jgi:hypothetical protein
MRFLFFMVSGLLLAVSTTLGADSFRSLFAPGLPSIKAWHVTSGSDGESHAKAIELALGERDFFGLHNGLKQYVDEHPEAFRIFSVPGKLDLPWHTTARKEMFILLRGSSIMILGDGTRRTFGPGSIVIFEDSTGHGHSGKTGPEGYTAINVDLGLIAK